MIRGTPTTQESAMKKIQVLSAVPLTGIGSFQQIVEVEDDLAAQLIEDELAIACSDADDTADAADADEAEAHAE